MKRNRLPQQPSRSPSSKTRTVHISDYFAILREHKWIAAVPFLVILGGAIALTLLATPVYQADSMLAIDTASGATGLLGELQLTDGGAKVDAEMEIMRSQRVAEGAAEILANERAMGDFLVEVNRYRPLDVFMRIVRRNEQPPAEVELECEPRPEGLPTQQFQFRFLDAGVHPNTYELEVAKIQSSRFGSERTSEMIQVESGVPFTAFGHDFTFTITGDPIGRLYKLTLRSKAGIARWLRGNTVIAQLGRNTGIIALGCTAETPRLAKEASHSVARSFTASKQKQKEGDAGRALEFLETRERAVKDDLDTAARALSEFVGENGVTFLSERAKALVEVTSSLEREALEYELRLEEQERAVAGLRGHQLGVGDVTHYVGADPTAAALAAQLHQLEVEYDGLTEELTDEMPQVKNLKTRIESARERLRAHLITRAESAVRVTKTAIARIAQFSEQKQIAAKKLPDKERTLANLTHKVRSLEAISAFLAEKKNEVRIAQASVFSNVRIVDEPLLPSERVSPNLIVNLLVGLFLATIAALATAFFAEYLDQSIKTPEDLERALDLPLYAALPAFKSVRSKDVRKLKTPMVTIAKPHSTLAEGYRSLRANIRFADFESPVRAFAITSAVLGEGKTTTSLNLAVVLAQAGSKVMVVDADLRRPATHAHLNGTLSPGLSDILLRGHSWRSVVRPVAGVENLEVIHAGAKPSNPGALLDSKEFLELVEELKTHYEYILFDVPPVLAVSDAASFFHKLDALFLLVQWRRCPIHVVQAAKDQAQRLGANLRGVIFNGFDARKSARRGYGHYGYYGYYGYYGKNRGYGYVADEDRKGKRSQTVKK